VLFENRRYVVAQRTPCSGAAWLGGPYFVVVKDTGRLVRASLPGKLYLHAVMRELSRLGVHGPGHVHERLFERFAASVAGHSASAWQVLVQGRTPGLTARALVDGTCLAAAPLWARAI